MPKRKKTSEEDLPRRQPPAITEEGREKQLVSLAVDLAEKQLREGTASSQVIVHYLKLGSSREKMEMEKMRHENELLRAKAEAIDSAKRSDALFEKAIEAMRSYGYGTSSEDDPDGSDIQ